MKGGYLYPNPACSIKTPSILPFLLTTADANASAVGFPPKIVARGGVHSSPFAISQAEGPLASPNPASSNHPRAPLVGSGICKLDKKSPKLSFCCCVGPPQGLELNFVTSEQFLAKHRKPIIPRI